MKKNTRRLAIACLFFGIAQAFIACVPASEAQVPPEEPPDSIASTQLLQPASPRGGEGPLSCQLTVEGEGPEAVVFMRIVNRGNQRVRLLRRNTAWDNATSVFDVRSASDAAIYIGIRATRGPVDESEYLDLSPQGGESARYPLGRYYAAPTDAVYNVNIASPAFLVETDGSSRKERHACAGTTVRLWPDAAVAVPNAGIAPQVAFSACSTSQQATFNIAKVQAKAALDTTASGIFSGSAMYTTWFGTWSSARSTTVNSVLNAVKAVWDSETIACESWCDVGWGAWTNYNSGVIHLCPLYFSDMRDFSGEDYWNRTGVYIHEMTHERNSAVLDYAYGTVDDRALAISDPNLAVLNADNYSLYSTMSYVSWIYSPITALFR